MSRRIRWFVSGTGFGIGLSVWAVRKIRSKVDEITPLAVTKATADSVLKLKDRLADVVGDARAEVVATEAALREEMGLDPKRKSQVK